MGTKIEWRRQKKESVNWNMEQYKLFIFNNREKMEKQINRATGNSGTIPKEVTFVSLVFQKEGKFF